MALNYGGLLPVLERLGDRVGDAVQIVTAEQVARQHYPQIDPDRPALVAAINGRTWAEDVARVLLKVYGADFEVTVTNSRIMEPVPLSGLATAVDWGEEIHLFVPPLPRPGSFTALQNVTARLRAPDGCPWDRELTWDKLRAFLLEESYELLAALDSGDPKKVAEEQGDLFLQLALQIQIAIEEGKYLAGGVMAGIIEKLIRRHPHVFGDTEVSGTEEVLANWEAIKRAERAGDGGGRRSPLAGIPAGLPALAQSQAYLDRMARLTQVTAPESPCMELAGMQPGEPVTAEMVGRALFELVAWAREHEVDAESALRGANARYAAEISD